MSKSTKPTGVTLNLINKSGVAVPQKFIERWVQEMVRLLVSEIKDSGRLKDTELVVAFLDVKEARRINSTFRGHDYPTDVLSFASTAPNIIGELVLCPTVVSRQAKEHGLLVREEFGHLILHGLLHLLGYDHESAPANAKKMYDLQDRVFAELLEFGKKQSDD